MRLPGPLADALRIGAVGDTVVYLTTASSDGRPNVAVQPFTDVAGDGIVLMPDLFAQKTKVNLNENLRAALTVALPGGLEAWVVEGPCNVFQWGHPEGWRFAGLRAGEVLARWGDWASLEPMGDLPEEVRPTVLAQRGVIALEVETVRRVGEGP
ncbi:MAG TPA: pyridoxamine 5'-phosphate oxidase family protein [Anaeromyxobacteraceae bacterium]|nr:pyridoxamine 5'-phosphate oxidase family protein [Anaeromyxobacteraceae bacterium]